jgi:predicted ribosome quality control (RQC) complex YloA/Tae2 family protein
MTITEFARGRNIQPQTISIYIRRHAKRFEGHTSKDGKTLELDDEAVKMLDEKYPLPKPVQVINGVDPEEYKLLQEEVDHLHRQYEAKMEVILSLQDKLNQAQERIGQAEAAKLLLEDKKQQLEKAEDRIEKMESELQELRTENARLLSRGLFARIFNN